MAPLTWREVSAPSFSGSSGGGAAAAAQAANLLNRGFEGMSAALSRYRDTRQQQNDVAFLSELGTVTDANELDRRLQQGLPTNVSPETLQYGLERKRHLLGNETVQHQNTGLQLRNDQQAWTNDQTRAFEAARPAAVERANQIRSLALQGTQESIEQANRLMAESSDVFTAAGFTPEDIGNWINGNASTSATGMAQQNAFQKIEDANFSQEQADRARAEVENVYQTARDPNEAAAMIRSNAELSPEVAGMALDFIAENGESLFGPAPSPQDVVWNQQFQERQNQPQNQGSSSSLMDRHEGGGRYDTLFEHAQRDPNSPMAGVDVSKATIGELIGFSSANGAYGQYQRNKLGYLATPMGRYQIVGSTLKAAAEEMGLSPDTVFTPEVQDSIFHHLIGKRLSGPRTMEGKIAGLREEWEGFRKVPDAELQAAITAYENGDRDAFTGPRSAGSGGGGSQGAAGHPGQQAQRAIEHALSVSHDNMSAEDNSAILTANNTLGRQADTVIEIGMADDTFNTTGPMLAELVERPHAREHAADTATRIHADLGGEESGMSIADVTKAMNQMVDRYHVQNDVAGALLKNAVEHTSWGRQWVRGLIGLEGIRRVNHDRADAFFRKFIDPDGDELTRLRPALEQFEQLRFRREGAAQLDQLRQEVEAAQQEHFRAQQRKQDGFDVDTESPLLRLQALMGRLETATRELGSHPLWTVNSRSRTGN